ncbi:ABC transporter ATP-binding protein [Streptomyces sp. NPDC013181]|uniref:ABC transporter ATP-binding protein n=1 Tax=Streptomyces sp. NPDC013181 TaxID=3364864 RepID=UPI00368D211D
MARDGEAGAEAAGPPPPMRVIGNMLRPYRGAVLLGLLLGALSTAAALAQPYFIGRLVEDIHREKALTGSIALLVALFVAEALLLGTQGYVLTRAGTGLVRDVRHTLVGRLLRMPMAQLTDFRRGDLMARVVTDTSMLRMSLTQATASLGLGVLTVIGATALMLTKDVVLTFTMLGCLAVTAVVSVLVAMRIRTVTTDMQERLGDFGSALQRALGAVSTIKISRAEEREAQRVGLHADATYREGVRQARLAAVMTPAANTGIQATFALVFAIGALRMRDGSLSIGDYSAFLLYLFYLISPLVTVFTSFAQLQQGMASAVRVQAVLGAPVEHDTVPGERAPHEDEAGAGKSALSFEDVRFGYDPANPVLSGLSLSLPERGLVAVVGPSGAGKSTLLSLAMRLWERDDGRISLYGTDVRDVPLNELRRRVGLVEQDAYVVDGTLRENLLLAAPDAGEADLARAVEDAALAPWVAGLEHGLDTQVGEAGGAVSGGQRQRIAVARALLSDPEVLVLDEVTSQLDGETERALRDALTALSKERAVLVTAHRLSTVQSADRIVVLEKGRVRAQGTHEELAASDELYRRLISTQLLADPTAGTAVVDKVPVR